MDNKEHEKEVHPDSMKKGIGFVLLALTVIILIITYYPNLLTVSREVEPIAKRDRQGRWVVKETGIPNQVGYLFSRGLYIFDSVLAYDYAETIRDDGTFYFRHRFMDDSGKVRFSYQHSKAVKEYGCTYAWSDEYGNRQLSIDSVWDTNNRLKIETTCSSIINWDRVMVIFSEYYDSNILLKKSIYNSTTATSFLEEDYGYYSRDETVPISYSEWVSIPKRYFGKELVEALGILTHSYSKIDSNFVKAAKDSFGLELRYWYINTLAKLREPK